MCEILFYVEVVVKMLFWSKKHFLTKTYTGNRKNQEKRGQVLDNTGEIVHDKGRLCNLKETFKKF
jgi:hypothetical protein